jgi:hypothetical protein
MIGARRSSCADSCRQRNFGLLQTLASATLPLDVFGTKFSLRGIGHWGRARCPTLTQYSLAFARGRRILGGGAWRGVQPRKKERPARHLARPQGASEGSFFSSLALSYPIFVTVPSSGLSPRTSPAWIFAGIGSGPRADRSASTQTQDDD